MITLCRQRPLMKAEHRPRLCTRLSTCLLFTQKVHQKEDKVKKEDNWHFCHMVSSLHWSRAGTVLSIQVSTIPLISAFLQKFLFLPLLNISLFWHHSVLQLHWIFLLQSLLVSSPVVPTASCELQWVCLGSPTTSGNCVSLSNLLSLCLSSPFWKRGIGIHVPHLWSWPLFQL